MSWSTPVTPCEASPTPVRLHTTSLAPYYPPACPPRSRLTTDSLMTAFHNTSAADGEFNNLVEAHFGGEFFS